MYYHHLDWPNRDEYVNYFRDEFIPKYIPDWSEKQTSPWGTHKLDGYWVFYPDKVQEEKIFKLQDFLKRNFDLPDISYVVIFRNTNDLPIHTDGPDDGSSGVNCTSLNLQLSGYEGTTMKFYRKVVDATGFIYGPTKVRGWNNQEVELVDQFDCFNTWSVLNTGVPHMVTISESRVPKICASIRFKGFPTYEESLAKIMSRTELI
jgi:hypothetical protein